MVGEAQRTRAPVQRLADSVAAYFVHTVLGMSLLTAVAGWWTGLEPAMHYAVVNAVPVLILACFFFSSRRRHTRSYGDWSSDVCSSDLHRALRIALHQRRGMDHG